jgi:hypothetical protein
VGVGVVCGGGGWGGGDGAREASERAGAVEAQQAWCACVPLPVAVSVLVAAPGAPAAVIVGRGEIGDAAGDEGDALRTRSAAGTQGGGRASAGGEGRGEGGARGWGERHGGAGEVERGVVDEGDGGHGGQGGAAGVVEGEGEVERVQVACGCGCGRRGRGRGKRETTNRVDGGPERSHSHRLGRLERALAPALSAVLPAAALAPAPARHHPWPESRQQLWQRRGCGWGRRRGRGRGLLC